MEYIRGLFGILVLLAIAYLFSNNKKAIDWKLVGIGISLQLVFGFIFLNQDIAELPGIGYFLGMIRGGFASISEGFVKFLSFSDYGAQFVFGKLANPGADHNFGVIFAFKILPVVIFFSSVTAGLYYLGVLQKIVYGIAWLMAKTMRLSGAESLSAAGNIF